MKQLFFIVGMFILASQTSQAQSEKTITPTYKSAIGIKFFPFGVTFKTNSSYRRSALEIIGYFKDGFTGTVLHEWTFTLNSQRNLSGYVGGGGHFGILNEKSGGGAVVGADGVIGLDYKFLHLPLNLSLDWQPSLQFGKTDELRGWGGIGVRFTL